jgi:hypothetical protein
LIGYSASNTPKNKRTSIRWSLFISYHYPLSTKPKHLNT